MNDINKHKILYLAPEIPALSATFVYNEIFKLRELNYNVLVATVHNPVAKVDDTTEKAVGDVFVVYQANIFVSLLSTLLLLITHPINFVKTFADLLSDIFSIGLFNRNAFGLVFRFIYASQLAKYINKNNIKHTHVHFAHVPTDIAMYAAGMTGTSFSVTSHANDIFQRGWLLQEKIKRSKFFVTISEFNKSYLTKCAPEFQDKIKVIYCGVDTTKFTMRTPHINPVFTFGFLARIVEKKGLEYLIKASVKLKAQNIQHNIQIVGDGPLSESLQKLTLELGLEEQIQFLGQMPNNQVSSWLKKLNAFVLPSVKDANGDMDGIPVSLMEAMASGVPVISTDLSGIKELVINQQTGFLAISADEDDLANKMISMINNSEVEINTITQQAEQHVNKNFNQLANAEKIGKLIMEGSSK